MKKLLLSTSAFIALAVIPAHAGTTKKSCCSSNATTSVDKAPTMKNG